MWLKSIRRILTLPRSGGPPACRRGRHPAARKERGHFSRFVKQQCAAETGAVFFRRAGRAGSTAGKMPAATGARNSAPLPAGRGQCQVASQPVPAAKVTAMQREPVPAREAVDRSSWK
jgi:hypothetical protein